MSAKAAEMFDYLVDEALRCERHEAIIKAGGTCGVESNSFGCTLPRGHQGPQHIAHSSLGQIVHTWREVRH